ncbi:hypothetical protein J3D52_002981 [Achromobacter insolitus]|nr:hypothetical protein [Achromobacter insolitus]
MLRASLSSGDKAEPDLSLVASNKTLTTEAARAQSADAANEKSQTTFSASLFRRKMAGAQEFDQHLPS